ncbi:MAG TPA: long-chain fatty acid--CoA ligase [Acidocella sp.]|nr:long-chain fatty acid--CoA ligase [Acidocella sp.]
MNHQNAPPQASGSNAATSLSASFDAAVSRFAARPALDFLGRRHTYAQLGTLVDRAAAGLQKLGVARGVKIGLCLPNTPYSVIFYYAILKTGGTVVNFNPLYTAREIESLARSCHVSILVSLDIAMIQDKITQLALSGLFSRVIVCRMTAALPLFKSLAFRVLRRRDLARIPPGVHFLTFEQLIAGATAPTPVEIHPELDIAVLQFTGGTTGTPKAAMLTHANLTANIAQIKAVLPDIAPGQERILGVLPFFHVFAMTGVMNLGLSVGAELLLLPRLDIKTLMRTLRRRRPTILPGVPTLFTAISNAAESSKKIDLSFLKFCISGGAPISAEALERFERLSHCHILEGYGLSETSPVVTFNTAGEMRHGSVGQALPGTTLEIRDPENPTRLLPQGERGEICVRGPQVMRGYYEQPTETANAFIEGAFRTGDIGYLDADGYLFIVDRIKDLILCGGYNVYPRMIEEAAYQHPAIYEAIAIGIPDTYHGQVPKLFVTLRPGCSATPVDILHFLAERLSKIELPKMIEIRETLPKTMIGKLSKKELLAEEAMGPRPLEL